MNVILSECHNDWSFGIPPLAFTVFCTASTPRIRLFACRGDSIPRRASTISKRPANPHHPPCQISSSCRRRIGTDLNAQEYPYSMGWRRRIRCTVANFGSRRTQVCPIIRRWRVVQFIQGRSSGIKSLAILANGDGSGLMRDRHLRL